MLEYVLLIGSAFLAGVINAVAGGGTLLTFPSLMSFGQLAAVSANATSTVALLPGSAAGAYGFRRELEGTGKWMALLLPPSLVGGTVGSLLLILLPGRYFDALIPWLLLTASLLFWAQPYLAKRLRPEDATGLPPWRTCAAVAFFQLLVAVYGGYFGAGIGILMLSALALMGLGDIHRMNAVKAVLAVAINGVSVVIFVACGRVNWPLAWPLALGAIAGGLAGARVGRKLPKAAVRWFVIAVGLGLAAYYFVKQANLLG